VHEAWRLLCYMWKRCEVSSLRKRARKGLVFDDVCVSECQGTWHTCDAVTVKKFETITVTFVFHCVRHHLLQLLSTAAILCANALQYADALLTLLHSFIKSDRSCAHVMRS